MSTMMFNFKSARKPKRNFYSIFNAEEAMVAEVLALAVTVKEIPIDFPGPTVYEISLGPDAEPATLTLPKGFTLKEMA